MKSRVITALFASLVVAFLFSACSSTEKALPETQASSIPSWFSNLPDDPNFIFVARTASSRDLQTSINRATTDARAEVGRVVEVRVEAMQKNFTEEVGVDEDATFRQMFEEVTRTVVATSLSGSEVKEQEFERDGNLWRAYVLMQYPIGLANQQFLNQVKEREEMYTRFRQAQSFQDLESAVQDFEDRRN